MHLERKARQHYVARFYLKRWQAEGRKKRMWVKSKEENKTYSITNLSSVCQKRDFYKIDVDEVVYGMLDYKYGHLLDEPVVGEMMACFDALRRVDSYMSRKLPKHEKLGVLGNNFIEDRYCEIENKIALALTNIVDAKEKIVEVLQQDLVGYYSDLLGLFCTQHFRTLRARANMLSNIKGMVLERDGETVPLTDEQMETTVKAIMFVESLRLVENLRRQDVTISLNFNASGVDLLTSSAPTILLPGGTNASGFNDGLYGFMALSPGLSMSISKGAGKKRAIEIGRSDIAAVNFVNRLIYDRSDRDVYSTSLRQLSDLEAD
ncbi:DUF4238 domain-containing protein [Burkholderia ubonensis]|uniref:DUF4238 domain-containing protein n=1 Tax=Burkholderia ubonensis subsp. mesacidophila TaxID=265293 RepID=A0A2A4FH29_9BURK|nr:DUF4238 domain-containing protein [Burkholderia ubonensis]PCE32691.1 hypothetical protein BZL54_08545 [Burkholderia ubonensis subsp. mesacidophila]